MRRIDVDSPRRAKTFPLLVQTYFQATDFFFAIAAPSNRLFFWVRCSFRNTGLLAPSKPRASVVRRIFFLPWQVPRCACFYARNEQLHFCLSSVVCQPCGRCRCQYRQFPPLTFCQSLTISTSSQSTGSPFISSGVVQVRLTGHEGSCFPFRDQGFYRQAS